MCGIAGIIGSNITEAEIKIVEQMKKVLVHRGPDDHGISHGEGFVFGHQRLSIIDLERGRQPMQTEDGRFVIVYNGEVYNYVELRDELIKQGVNFTTSSDTEVILKLMQIQGVGSLMRMNGMFAFAIYDKKEKVLLCARDPFGIKPFYYTINRRGQFIFSSEIKALLVHPEVRPKLNFEALQEYLTFQFCLNDKTLFRNIQKLEPGCFLILNLNESKPRVKRYWNLDYTVDNHHTEEYFVDSISSLIKDATKLQLRSDVEVGAYLSGGMDSSTVASLAAGQYKGRLKCFHGKFSEAPEYDESIYAKEVATKINADFFEVVPTSDQFVSLLSKLIYCMDEPAAGPGLFPQFLVSKLASQKVKVVLAGTGGDEIFGGYARYNIAYLEQCLKGAIFETQEEGNHIVTMESIIPNLSLLKQYVPMLKSFWADGLFEDMDRRYYRLINRSHDLKHFLHQDIVSHWNEEKMFLEFKGIFNHPNTQSYLNKMTHFDQKTLLPALLQVEDRVSMANSLESRVPLLDTRLVDLVTKMPATMKFQGGKTKYIFKKAIKNILSDNVLNRKDKMGFPVPLKEWYEGPAKGFIRDVLLSEEVRQRGLFNRSALEQMIYKEQRYSRQIWGVLCLELWFQQFKVEF